MTLTKTFFLFFLIIIIVCVTFAPKSISDEGQTSGSKDEENNLNEKEEEEEEEILDEEFKLNLHFCQMEVFLLFKRKDPFDNFCEGLLNINGDNFDGTQSYTELTQSYYYDLLVTLQKLNPQLISPKIFCHTHYRKDAQKCIRLIKDAGCDADADGITCISHLYLYWKLRDNNTTTHPIPGTRDLSDKMLLEALFRGYKDPSNLDDEELLQEYYYKHGRPQISLEYDLRQARFDKYGVRSVSYNDLGREYLRRENLKHITEFYDNHYANYLISEIKKNDCSKFKSRKKYCKEYLQMRR